MKLLVAVFVNLFYALRSYLNAEENLMFRTLFLMVTPRPGYPVMDDEISEYCIRRRLWYSLFADDDSLAENPIFARGVAARIMRARLASFHKMWPDEYISSYEWALLWRNPVAAIFARNTIPHRDETWAAKFAASYQLF
jgi:hypothetical protein